MPITFRCPDCSQQLSVDSQLAGKQAKCPKCEAVFSIPAPSAPPLSAVAVPEIFCPKCGQRNLENNYQCTACAFVLHGPAQQQYAVDTDATMRGLIPYKNLSQNLSQLDVHTQSGHVLG